MIYRITLDLPFNKKADAQPLVDLALKLVEKAVVINEGKDNEERGFVAFRECNHDEPSRTNPDVILGRWEVI